MNGPEVSRRGLLKAAALGTGAGLLGWRPALSAPDTPLRTDTIPASGSIAAFGVAMAVSPEVLDEVRPWAEERLRRHVADSVAQYGATRPAGDERWSEVEPGGDPDNPLFSGHYLRLRQDYYLP